MNVKTSLKRNIHNHSLVTLNKSHMLSAIRHNIFVFGKRINQIDMVESRNLIR